ncbi:MAG: carbonic anhydrase family protein [Aquificota bacterium]|nr:MAG: carbonic anhydrase family protein [Aquificota bacterium]
MRKKVLGLILALSFSNYSIAGEWSYHGEHGPEHWGDIKKEFIMCKIGKNQSPVDLNRIVKAELKEVDINYKPGGISALNNGHTIKVSYEPGSYIVIDGIKFELKQFHFHSPSEHKIKGKQYPLEAHFVHADKDGNLAVIGVVFKEGKENPIIKQIWENLPMEEGKEVKLSQKVNAYELLPEDKNYYRYSGSLTTPPCSEGVRWIVMEKPLEVSKEQIEKFRKAMGNVDTNRPVQPLNARLILEKE